MVLQTYRTMKAILRTIHCTDWKDEPITYYEMDIKFQHAYNNYTYFSLEGETKQGFTERIAYDIRKLYSGTELKWTEE